jgi:hypothetical protein
MIQRQFVELYFIAPAPLFLSQNRRFQFKKRGQLFIRTHNKPLPAIAMRVSNPDGSPPAILSERSRNVSMKRNGNDNGNEEVKHESRDKSSIG